MGPLKITRYRAQLGVHARYFLVRLLKEKPQMPRVGRDCTKLKGHCGRSGDGKDGRGTRYTQRVSGRMKSRVDAVYEKI